MTERDGFFRSGDFGAPTELAPGVRSRLITRGSLMFSLVELDEGASTPIHSHDEEQMGLILEGSFERFQDGSLAILKAGDGFHVPSNVPHGGTAVGGPCRILDVFTPPRKSYLDRSG